MSTQTVIGQRVPEWTLSDRMRKAREADPKHRRLHNYEVRAIDDAWRVDSKPICVVRHRREDGAERLAAKVLMRMAEIHEED